MSRRPFIRSLGVFLAFSADLKRGEKTRLRNSFSRCCGEQTPPRRGSGCHSLAERVSAAGVGNGTNRARLPGGTNFVMNSRAGYTACTHVTKGLITV